MKVGCVIRFKNSASTLPQVLASLAAQTVRPDLIIGVDNGSTDNSADIMRAAGAQVIEWTERYSHPRVLNFGIEHCPAHYVLVLSSHTTLDDPQVIQRMVAALQDPAIACVSAKWDTDPYYTDHITWAEMQCKGMRLCSIYTNSVGMIRRSCWETTRFDESLPTAEDYDWAVAQLRQGHSVRRLSLPFSYLRHGHSRTYEFTHTIFRIAAKHGLKTIWLGPKGTVRHLITTTLAWLRTRDHTQLLDHWDKLRAWWHTRNLFTTPAL